jgi:type I restriction enzyme R subunit
MALSEADTRTKLIAPVLHALGWTEDLIRREETAGAIEIIEGKPWKQARGRLNPPGETGSPYYPFHNRGPH